MLKIYVCPKCNDQFLKSQGKILNCNYCNTPIIETSCSIEQSYNWSSKDTHNEVVKQIFDEYVKDNPLYSYEEEQRTKEKRAQERAIEKEHEIIYGKPKTYKKNVPKCPTCGSTKIEKIGTLERGVSVAAFGLFSGKLGKTKKCNHCGYKW